LFSLIHTSLSPDWQRDDLRTPATWPLSLHDDRLLTDIHLPPGAHNTFKSMPGVSSWDTRARHILILLRSISTWMFSTLDATYLILFYTSEHWTGRNKQRWRSECSPNSAGRQSLHVVASGPIRRTQINHYIWWRITKSLFQQSSPKWMPI